MHICIIDDYLKDIDYKVEPRKHEYDSYIYDFGLFKVNLRYELSDGWECEMDYRIYQIPYKYGKFLGRDYKLRYTQDEIGLYFKSKLNDILLRYKAYKYLKLFPTAILIKDVIDYTIDNFIR